MRDLLSKLVSKLHEHCRVRVGEAIEAVHGFNSGRQPTRLQMLLFLSYMIWGQVHAHRQSAHPAVARSRETSFSPQTVRIEAPCRNNAVAKAAEVHDALVECSAEGTPLRAGLNELYRRGAFRHEHDVAYAAIALTREWSTVDELVVDLARDYAGIDHRCDPVYPPS